MKNIERNLLLTITAVFLVILACVFIVRQQNGSTISLSDIENTVGSISSLENGKININTADAQQLQQLPKIGEILSERIVAYREKNGAFEKLEDIKNVSGIGNVLFNSISDYITLGE